MANNPHGLPYEVRSLIAMDMTLEKKVYDTFMSVLTMMEHADGTQEVSLTLSLNELRQHVQWCQYAAQSIDTANRMNTDVQKLNIKLIKAQQELRNAQTSNKRRA